MIGIGEAKQRRMKSDWERLQNMGAREFFDCARDAAKPNSAAELTIVFNGDELASDIAAKARGQSDYLRNENK